MNGLDIGLAFIEGLAVVASPCILPVLPLVLSTSINGGKARPFGIIAGFIAAFSAFVLLSRQIVIALHVDPDVIRYVSLTLLFVLGLVLLFEKLSELFSRLTQRAANLGGRVGAGNEGGFAGGLVIGALIGLVWTPCAGPILAAVLVQAIRSQTNLQSVSVTLAFSLGAGIPMLVIALTGRKIMSHFGFLARHTSALRKLFAVLILASVAYLGFGSYAQTLFKSSEPVQLQNVSQLENGLKNPYPAPELKGIQYWLNSKPLTLSNLKGKVILIDFWTYSCINCVRTLPYITGWDRLYRDKGLVIIGVHAPEFEFEKNVANIKSAMARYGIGYPVAVDNNLETWLNYKNSYWPAHYLIDKNGQVVYTHFGEGDYGVTENNVRYLLGLKGKAEAKPPASESTAVADQTPETYLGYGRAGNFSGASPLIHDTIATYQTTASLPKHYWTLGGKWRVEGEKIIAQDSDAVLTLKFTSRKVFMVMGTSGGTRQQIRLRLNGRPLGENAGKDVHGDVVVINGHNLYELINQASPKTGLLEIKALAPGFEAYAFTFGD